MRDIKELSDEELVEYVRKQNKESYIEVIRRYKDKLLRYALYLTGDEAEAEDIVQESFIKAYVSLNGFDEKKKFSSWIYRIVHNESMNVLKKKKNHISLELGLDFDSGVDLEDELIRMELKRKARYCLKKLPVIYREPLVLCFLEERSYQEISDILRIPVSTVGTRINRAKVLMKKICQE